MGKIDDSEHPEDQAQADGHGSVRAADHQAIQCGFKDYLMEMHTPYYPLNLSCGLYGKLGFDLRGTIDCGPGAMSPLKASEGLHSVMCA